MRYSGENVRDNIGEHGVDERVVDFEIKTDFHRKFWTRTAISAPECKDFMRRKLFDINPKQGIIEAQTF
jgi:hypothetical protein